MRKMVEAEERRAAVQREMNRLAVTITECTTGNLIERTTVVDNNQKPGLSIINLATKITVAEKGTVLAPSTVVLPMNTVVEKKKRTRTRRKKSTVVKEEQEEADTSPGEVTKSTAVTECSKITSLLSLPLLVPTHSDSTLEEYEEKEEEE
ncbi:hypothetical protein PFISCL1PPCAC_6739, partial [Pristionchus fissidentatus]